MHTQEQIHAEIFEKIIILFTLSCHCYKINRKTVDHLNSVAKIDVFNSEVGMYCYLYTYITVSRLESAPETLCNGKL